MTAAFINGTTIKRGDGATPTEVFAAIEEVVSISGLGKTKPLVDTTNFDSAAREYIAGLADGQEITLECNYLPGGTNQQALVNDVDTDVASRNFEILITDGTTPKTYAFAVVPLSYVITPSPDDKNMISFTLKITGDITIS